MKDLARFASALWQPADVVELRAIFPRELKADAPPPRSVWLKAEEIAAGGADKWAEKLNGEGWGIYAGANPRKGPGGRDGAAVARCPAFFVDFDGGVHPDEAMAVVADKCLPEPSMVVATGHGVHCWWVLEEPLADLKLWTGRQQALIGLLGTDKAIHDPPRVARLPGFKNTKPPAADAALIVCEPGRRYALSSFPEGRATVAVVHVNGDAKVQSLSVTTKDFIVNGASNGERNKRCFRAAADARAQGFGEDAACGLLIPAAVGCGLAEAEARAAIHSAFSKERLTEREYLIHKGIIAEVKDEQDWGDEGGSKGVEEVESPRFGNVDVRTREIVDGNGKPKVIEETTYIHLPKIGKALREITDGWPKTYGGVPFVLHPEKVGRLPTMNDVRYLPKTADLFAWIGEETEPYWSESPCYAEGGGKRSPATKEEFHGHIRKSGERVESISTLPHYPEIQDDVFYLPCTLPEATGKHLEEFISRLNPETENDRIMLEAMTLTPFWGGPAGTRPAFVLRSRHGRGSGKTSTATAIAQISGGHFDIDAKEEWRDVQRRIMADDAMQQRVAFIDNVRGKLDATHLEALVTAPKISGWRMYVGNWTRPNYTTLFITSSFPKLSNDLAKRAVVIDIGKQRHTEGFVSWVRNFIRQNHINLVADCLAKLRGPETGKISDCNRDRFQEWQDGVLSKLPRANEVAALIIERRAETDADAEAVENIANAIADWLRSKSLDPGRQEPHKITRDEMYAIIKGAGLLPDNDITKPNLKSWLDNKLGSDGALAPLTDSPSRKSGRCWLWSGGLWDPKDDTGLPPV